MIVAQSETKKLSGLGGFVPSTKCYTPLRLIAGVVLSIFLTQSVFADEIDYDKETCEHLLVKVEDYASSVLEIQDTEKALNEYKQDWKEPLSLLTQYSQLYVNADCDRALLRKALYRLVQYRKINEPDILGTKRW